MSNSKMTRRALLTSVMALVLCFAMLTGTTFAWFTDQETSGNNKIVAGNLDIEMYNALTADDAAIIDENTKLFDGVEYWEPGVVSYENITIANKGNLALKYQLSVNFEDNGLADALKVGVIDGGIADGTSRDGVKDAVATWMPIKSFVEVGELVADDNDAATTEKTTETYGIVIYWEPSDNDNKFNGNDKNATKEFSVNFGVELVATQLAAEYDAFDNQYDANAGDYYSALYAFDSEDDLLAFAPTVGNAASSGLSITDDGKAQIDASGAWKKFDVNLADSEYVISYDMDITNLAVGENVTVDTGETAAWKSTPIMLERGSTKVYYGLAKNEYLGALEGTAVTLTHTYSYNSDNKLVITTTVSDGVDTITYSTAVESDAETSLYWDIYFATEAGKATMDNYSIKETAAVVDNAAEFAAVLAEGGNIVLNGDINVETAVTVSKDTVLDLNGHTLTVTGERAAIINVTGDADLTVIGGKMVVESTNSVLNGTGTSTGAGNAIVFDSTGTLRITGTEIIGSRRGGWRAVEVYAGEAYIENAKIDCTYGSGVNASGDAYVELNNCDITVTGMYSAPYNSVCFSVMNGAELVVNSGNYKLINDNTYSTGDTHGGWVAIVMSSGGTITVNGGTFTNVPAEGFKSQYERAIFELENNAPAVATLNIYGGTFIPQAEKIYGGYGDKYYPTYNVIDLKNNGDGSWTAVYDGAIVDTAEELITALAKGENVLLTANISCDAGISIPAGVSFDGNGKTVTYTVADDYHLVKLDTDAEIKNVTLENYRVRTEDSANGTVTMSNVVINMDNDLTGLDISRGAGTAKLTNVVCKGTKDATHLDPATQGQVDYTPYGDVLLGGAWALEATGCDFGSFHGWNTRNGSNVSLNNTTYTVFRMHYWNNRTLYVNGVETAWSESGAIPVAHDVGGCWSVQPAFK